MTHPLSGQWILHYFDGDIPWRTLSDLPEDEALAINATTGKTSGRFCPLTGNDLIYQDRLNVETWDSEQHLARGGRMENDNPVYDIVSDVERPARPYRQGNCIAIPADFVPCELMSVSFCDSFHYYCRDRKDLTGLGSPHGRTYDPAQFADIVKQRPELAKRWSVGYYGNEGFCVEVRLYTRRLPVPSQSWQSSHSVRPSMIRPPFRPNL